MISPLTVAESMTQPIRRTTSVLTGGPLEGDPAEVTGQGFNLPRRRTARVSQPYDFKRQLDELLALGRS